MAIKIFQGKIEKGQLILDDPFRYQAHKASLEGKRVDLSLKKHRENRSDNQNRYYWGVVIDILSNHCGYTPDEMHDALKEKFLGSHERDEHGLQKIKSSAKLTTDEFIRYTNEIVIWAATEMQVYIPDPSQTEF